MKIFSIEKNDAGQRLDKFLSKAVKSMPPSLMYKSIRTKKIKVNRKRAQVNQILIEGDTVQLFLPDELFNNSCKNKNLLLAHISPSFSVVYEDENILLVDKPAGLQVHSDDKEDTNTLITQILAYLFKKGEYNPASEKSFAPALCNRIDRNTAGIVIAAKKASALREINQLIKERKLTKKYICAVHGIMERKSDILSDFYVKDEKNNTVKIFKNKIPNSKSVKTGYKVLCETDNDSLLEVELFTGRTHQIRAHLASIGHPLLGDGKYGINKEEKKLGYKFQALYSYCLKFNGCIELSYLNGKEFKVPLEKIWFVKDFL